MTTPAPDAPFRALPDLIAEHARQRPGHPALRADDDALSYAELDALVTANANRLFGWGA
jgi:non-ribosomal peptide synthetase component E (peptide arylation enzyme)